ncbi:tRNA glutamyl-Q(34) synthetase GluQRS [Xanthomonas hortorum pv. cynarae]|uniref:tRNA glutamyl-Q(34) synthetase GluQRS n=1 Tax=Xanthomonas hortorum TaxID=56454 RepID=UPI000CEF0DD7|nr:tRNA glutamyl-Q(34) synthetase GluQRS [Xanthomonas hortorum]MCC4626414.1 tRNA glutamyl-Q(34) synthetase GluQRS [Xanthomonas campestris pv. nigromaculans]MCE4347807.1 tRNA glutamyl-Q(34) synthetase GluQRS [Xanthomonas hortorum pv. cynarae]PPU48970.1 tRNA glutamyl-Q(34) synthetase GluQRS [Xanthomonas hortorum pv. cynarae]CAD0332631.1 Glutamyl-Q tRNA(Asp) synthetase [Xanthomonas hortorum pv. cynarae]CAD0332637.1 Glutamyl-Q tRNA(Asp) synthetase [Xanthomonas hortorum pv. cynarae]
MSSPSYRGRFAPSPTGPLHFGSLLAAFGSWLLARHAGGEWCVRIEDIDPPRAEPGATQRQLRTLAAFGLSSDIPVIYQSDRDAQYAAALTTLLEPGLAFECSCSRADLAGMGGIHHACVAPLGTRRAVRLRVPPQAPVGFDDALQGHVMQDVYAEVGDVVLRRADGYWAYQLAVVVDDAAQIITDVVRGADLLDSTPRQLLLQRALGLPQPRYLHLPLILDGDGRKLSKSHDAPALDDADPLPALHAAWAALGQNAAALPRHAAVDTLLQHAVQHFSPQLLPRHHIRT